MSTWHCYLLVSDDGKRTYIGATVDPNRRLQQHNGEKAGGARATHGRCWRRHTLVSGFPDSTAALQFEWAWKFRSRKHGHGLLARLRGLKDVLESPRSTSKARPFSEWPEPPRVVTEGVATTEPPIVFTEGVATAEPPRVVTEGVATTEPPRVVTEPVALEEHAEEN